MEILEPEAFFARVGTPDTWTPLPETPMPTVDRTTHCPFPKHAGKEWEAVIEDDRPYVEWLVGGDGPDMEDDLYDLLITLLED